LQLPSVTIDFSSILIAAVGTLIVALGKRWQGNIDKSFDDMKIQIAASRAVNSDENRTIDRKIDNVKVELTANIREVSLDVKDCRNEVNKSKDKATDMITAVRVDLEDKFDAKLEKAKEEITRGLERDK